MIPGRSGQRPRRRGKQERVPIASESVERKRKQFSQTESRYRTTVSSWSEFSLISMPLTEGCLSTISLALDYLVPLAQDLFYFCPPNLSLGQPRTTSRIQSHFTCSLISPLLLASLVLSSVTCRIIGLIRALSLALLPFGCHFTQSSISTLPYLGTRQLKNEKDEIAVRDLR